MSNFRGNAVWRHANGTICCHRLIKNDEAPEGYYCMVAHSDVFLDDDADILVGYGRHRAETPTILTSSVRALIYVVTWVIGSCAFACLMWYLISLFVQAPVP